ncbi:MULTISPECIES: hypothetical protein [Methylosinus]|uniref:Uncharacterized protein n=1 Tax=Methylosinus trichosporium (strain ATCC 35070 / NCIMB 11131 / UNIQEM 75 / OB3b) TaxID=595536 RepID=A0A2D2CYD9_METT3|nr:MULTISPECIES: hypothetical protein [Methylosinus]ATQ67762.1 hypothetical protein CQW49_07545 [Methylosinus trichosporium OB3b]OBS51781.1 hypothetical protein A8B73_14050 [Methylosinus sp. 3S-1]
MTAIDAKPRLAATIARGRERETSHERRAVPPIEAVTITRTSAHYQGTGNTPTMVTISLPRVRFLERPER